jgi:PAP2 superfamily protein
MDWAATDTLQTTPTSTSIAAGAANWIVPRRVPIVLAFLAVSLAVAVGVGDPDRPWVVVWLIVALFLVCWRSPRRMAGVVIDWLPLLVIAAGYDLVRSFASDLVPRAIYTPQLRFDEVLFGGKAPTVTLQQWLHPGTTPHWWDYLVFCFYLSHFAVTPTFAAYLYLTDRNRFHRLAMVIVWVCIAGFATYMIVPAAPPWLASRHSDLAHTVRVVQRVWANLGATGPARVFNGNASLANPVGALPSLHAAWPFVVLLFVWRRAPRGRWVVLAYNMAMWFVLVYGAEHYVSDIMLGWVYAIVGFIVVNRVIDRRQAQQAGTITTSVPA